MESLIFITKYLLLTRRRTFILPKRGGKNAFILLAANYGNLGDVAITYSQRRLLEEHGFNVSMVYPQDISAFTRAVRTSGLGEGDIITLIGGGNMGLRYYQLEMLRLYSIWRLKSLRIICFPQTLEYNLDKRIQRFIVRKFYAKPEVVAFRDYESYSLFKQHNPSNALLAPDIVLGNWISELIKETKPKNRGRLVICREDSESTGQLKEYVDKATEEFEDFVDTHIGRDGFFSSEELQRHLVDLLYEVNAYESVITDRLHGMILSLCLGKKVEYFDNVNHKLTNVAKSWNLPVKCIQGDRYEPGEGKVYWMSLRDELNSLVK